MPLQAGAQGLAQQLRKPRVWVYGGVIVAVLALMAVGLWQRPELRLDAHRDRGVMARLVSGGQVENVYRLQIRSASMQAQTLDIRVQATGDAPSTSLQLVASGPAPVIEAAGTVNLPVTVRMPAEQAYALRGQTVPIRFEVSGAGGLHQVQASSTFLVPR